MVIAAWVTVIFFGFFVARSRKAAEDGQGWVFRSFMGCLWASVVFVGTLSLLIILLYALFSGSE